MLGNKILKHQPPLGRLPRGQADTDDVGRNGFAHRCFAHRFLMRVRTQGTPIIPMLLLVLAGSGLGSCSWTDRNFSELRGRVTDWFDSEDSADRNESNQARTSSNTNRYPSLHDVPDSSNLSADERRAAIQARLSGDTLVADTSGTRITDAGSGSATSFPLLTSDSEISPLLQSGRAKTAPVVQGRDAPDPYRQAGNPKHSASSQIVPTRIGAGPLTQPFIAGPVGMQSRQSGANAPATFIGSIFFGLGSIRLRSDDLSVIKQVAHVHRQRGGDVLIIAHASSRYRKASRIVARLGNFDLSLRRARAIRQALIRQGLRGKQIRIVARGDGEAQAAPNRPEIEAADRRADVFLVL